MRIESYRNTNADGLADPAAVSSPAANEQPPLSVEDLAEIVIETGRREREALRNVAEAQAETARAARQKAISEMRAAADDRFSSAISQAVVGVAAAAVQGVAAVGGASAAAEAAAAGGSATTAASETARATAEAAKAAAETRQLAYQIAGSGAGAIDKAGPLIDVWSREAAEHDIRSRERSDAAQSLAEYAQRTRAAADASRSIDREVVSQAGRAMEAQDRAMMIAIGRE